MRAFSIAVRVFLALAAVVVLALAYLHRVGLPAPLVRRITERLRAQGLPVDLGRISWDFPDAVVVHHVRLFDREGGPCPMAEAGQLKVILRLADLLQREVMPTRIEIRHGSFRVSAQGRLARLDDPANLSARGVRASVQVQPTLLRIEELAGEFMGVGVEGRGVIVRAARPGPRRSFAEWVELWVSSMAEDRLAWVAGLAGELNALDLGGRSRAQIAFTIHPVEAAANDVVVRAEGGGFRCRGVAFHGWSLEAQLKGKSVQVPAVRLWCGADEARASGVFDLASRTVEARFFNSLPPACWWAVLPAAWRGQAGLAAACTGGTFRSEIVMGPAPLGEAVRKLSGWADLAETDVRGAWIEQGHVAFARNGNLLRLEEIEAVIGRDRQQGRLDGKGVFHIGRREFRGRLKSSFDPNAVVSLMTPNQSNLVRRFAFDAAPPRGKLDVCVKLGPAGRLRFDGAAAATNFTYRGAAVAACHAGLAFSNDLLTLDPFRVVRGEGEGNGWVRLDFSNSVVSMDMDSTADPKAVARMIGPGAEKILEPFRFEGPTHVAARGQVDYQALTNMNLAAEIEAERLGLKWFTADRCAFRLAARGSRVDAEDIAGVLYGGSFAGRVSGWPEGSPTNLRYEVAGSMLNVDFRELVGRVREEDSEVYQGRLAAGVRLTGLAGEGQAGSVTGTGTVAITHGRLLQIPLLGGLSDFLSRLYPGLGFISQTDARADFIVRKSRVETRNAMLEGNVISIAGKGKYQFDEKLDFKVQVHLLSEGPVASVLNLVAYPFTKLFLEFKLGGNLREPYWRPVNLPKELYLKFA